MLRCDDYDGTDASDEKQKLRKLNNTTARPIRVFAAYECFIFKHDEVVERISADQAVCAPPSIDIVSGEPDQLT